MNPRASVIVPTCNRVDALIRLLDALDRQTVRRDQFEVIVIDDGSTDRTPEVLATRPHVLSARQPNQGPGLARNHGVDRASGALLVFVDDDCVPDERWLQRMLEAEERAATDVAGFGGEIQPLCRGFLADFVQAERLVDHSPLAGDPSGLRYVVTANAAFRGPAFRAVAGFDAGMTTAGEDVDLSLRIRAHGHRLLRVPDAKVHHAHPTSLERLLRIYRRSGGARVRLASRHAAMGLDAGAGQLLSLGAWRFRIADYRSAGAPAWRIPVYLVLRTVCLLAFAYGVLEARVGKR